MALPRLCVVGGDVITEVVHRPSSGIRQGDPLSPALFVLAASQVLLILNKLLPERTVIMYVDDLLIYCPCSHFDALVLVRSIVLKVQIFGSFSGLQMNVGKSRCLLKNLLSPPYAGVGLRVVCEFKYLGVLLGHVTVDHVYASVVATTYQRAKFLAQFPLHLQERCELLKVWILSLFEFPARVYLPTQLVS